MPMSLIRGKCVFIEGKVLLPSQKIIINKFNGTFMAEELWFQQTFVSRKRNSIIGKLVFKGKINSG